MRDFVLYLDGDRRWNFRSTPVNLVVGTNFIQRSDETAEHFVDLISTWLAWNYCADERS